MIVIQTEVNISGVNGSWVCQFFLNCTDEQYQQWWPGTHLAFHTIRRFPGGLGNRVYFDEYVGRRRLKFKGVVTKIDPGKKLVWQMVFLVRLPAWLVLEFDEGETGLKITHTFSAGFNGLGKVFDPLLRIYLSREFAEALDEHVRVEFAKLAERLA